jgi:NadR type nicotinamide-nucleotide adenylyltransferase
MIRIATTGSECTGKTTLAKALAAHYDTIWVPEYARQFVDEKGGPPDSSDLEAIGRGQMALEHELSPAASGLVILDTDLLSTTVYSRHYYGDCPTWIEEALTSRPAELYLLCDIDVPWLPDGNQRDRALDRTQMQRLFREALLDRALPFLEIAGTLEARLADSVAGIDGLSAARGPP